MTINKKIDDAEFSELCSLLEHFAELERDHSAYVSQKEIITYQDLSEIYGQEKTYERLMCLWNKVNTEVIN